MTNGDGAVRDAGEAGRLLKEIRLARGLTQAELAARAAVDRSWINQIERGKRPMGPSPRAKLARALKVDPAELGAAEEAAGRVWRPLHVRLAEAEAADDRLLAALGALTDRVEALERQVRAKRQRA